MIQDKPLKIGQYEFQSRLIVGTGKYETFELMEQALAESETELVTVAIRRVNLDEKSGKTLMDFINTSKMKILPNTAGCYSAEEAIRVARLARESGVSDMIKLEVLGDEKTLLPDPIGTLEATKVLVKEGFTVLTYTSDDPIVAKRLEDEGATAVMPAGAPIGSGQGILNANNIRLILESLTVPVIVDAGVGTASDVSRAFELGVEAVLLNTGIAGADNPVMMASAMKHAALAGRQSYLAGRIPKRRYAKASSPILDF
jgi:thiazole synthase